MAKGRRLAANSAKAKTTLHYDIFPGLLNAAKRDARVSFLKQLTR